MQARAPALPGVVLASPWTVLPESAHSLSLGGAHRQGTRPCPQMESKLPLPWAPLAVLFTCPAGGGSPRQVQTGVQGGLGSEGETPVSWVIRQVRGPSFCSENCPCGSCRPHPPGHLSSGLPKVYSTNASGCFGQASGALGSEPRPRAFPTA